MPVTSSGSLLHLTGRGGILEVNEVGRAVEPEELVEVAERVETALLAGHPPAEWVHPRRRPVLLCIVKALSKYAPTAYNQKFIPLNRQAFLDAPAVYFE